MQNIEEQILAKIRKAKRGTLFFCESFTAFGTAKTVNKALERLYNGILNQSNFARITGVNTSLMRHYLCGVRNPSKKKLAIIEKNLRTFAAELSTIRIS
ncbi:MAG: DUF6088 family protein [Prevotellaceae bacterium]|nr:DUF6088 family protein [Prevotellaceae bacterium]